MDESSPEGLTRNIQPEPSVWRLEEKSLLESAKEKFNRVFRGKVIEKKIPKVDVDVYYGAHANKEEVEGLRPHLQDCDIYIPEMFGWSPERYAIMNLVSAGKITPEDAARKIGYNPLRAPYDFQLLKMLYKSGKPVAFVDYPKGDPKFDEFLRINRRINEIREYWHLGKTFEDIIREVKERIRDSANFNTEREGYMVNNLRKAVSDSVQQNPSLLSKAKQNGNLKILMSLGSVHTPVSHEISRSDTDVRSKYSRSPYNWGYLHEGTRKYQLGKNVDDEFAAKMLMEGLIIDVFGNEIEDSLPDYEDRSDVYRKIAGQFSYQDVKQIIKRNSQGMLLPLRADLIKTIRQKTLQLDELLQTVPELVTI